MDITVNQNTVITFDLDDTLYNEIEYLKSAYRYIANKLDDTNSAELYAYIFSLYRDGKNVFDYLSADYNTSKEVLIDIYRNHIPNIKLFDHTLDFMKSIQKNNGKIAIITDGRKSTQLNKIKSLGIFELIDKIIISEEIGSEKPAIQNYKAIEEHFKRSNYCYIADNLKKDFITPNTLGWGTIGLIDNGLNIHSKNHNYFNDKHKPKHFIESFENIKIIEVSR